MAKYLLVVAFLSVLSINDVAARNFWKRQASDDPVIDDVVTAPNTDAGAPPSTDGAVATDALVSGTEPMTDLPSDTENPAVSTGTEVAPDSSPQSEAPGTPPVALDLGSTAPGETSGPLPEQVSSEPAGTPQSETAGSILPEASSEPVNTIETESPGSPPAESPETLPPMPEEAAGATSESVADATVQGSEPILQPGSELPSVVPGSEALPVAPIVPIVSETAVIKAGNPAVISELIPEIIKGLQPVPVGSVESGSVNPTISIRKIGATDVKGTVVPNPGSSTGGPVPTEDAGVFPFQGGFVFDSPFFSFAQIEDYFKKLEKAMEKIFRDTMKDVNTDSDLYRNTTERVVDVDGTRYKVHTTIIRGGDENNAVSIEAVSAVPESKRRKRSLF